MKRSRISFYLFHFIISISSSLSEQTQPNQTFLILSIPKHYPSITTQVNSSQYTNMSWGTHIYVVYNHIRVEGAAICTPPSQTPTYMLPRICIWVEGLVLHSLHEIYHHSQPFPVKYLPQTIQNIQKHEMDKLWHLSPLPLTPWDSKPIPPLYAHLDSSIFAFPDIFLYYHHHFIIC